MQLPLPENEDARLENLRSYGILDTPPEPAFDDLTHLTAFICGTPIALIGLIDLNRQWFKAAVGWDVQEIPREVSFCASTILIPELLVVPDTLRDRTFGTSPLATHGGIRFYAGVPLITGEGYALGTLCVMDCVPRALTEEQTDALQRLAHQVVAQFELRRRPQGTAVSQDGLADGPGVRANGIVGESESSVGRDATEHKQEVETLRNQEARLRVLVERMPAVMWTTDADFQITFSAGAGFAAPSWHPNQTLGISLSEYMQTDDSQSPLLAAHLRALAGESANCEIVWNGRTFEVCVEPLRDSGERIVGCIGTALHAPGRQQAEEALRSSEARYRSLFEGVVHGLYRVSVDGQFFEVNGALAAMLGYDSPNEVVKLNVANLHADQEERSRLVQKWVNTERIEDEVNWNRRNGEIIRVRLSGRPLTDQQGVVQGFEFIAEDVTERRALEGQLRQAQKIEAVGQLAGGLAHEFNNFLGIILGYSELMSVEAGGNECLCRQIAEIKAATQRASSMTHQLLAFGRKQLMEPKVLDLNSAVWETQKLLHRLLPANIDVVPVLSSTLGRVKADPGQVQQVLINLVINARDAMPKGGKVVIETAMADLDEVSVSKHVGLPPGTYVTMSVSDTGGGMDDETSSRVFEPFFTTKEPGKGTGLGLSTVYGIVKQSGGYITVNSAVGKGTTFRIYLPLVQPADEETNVTPSSPIEQSGGETILVVEDETTLRRLLCFLLERQGYKVYEARDGAEAVEIFRQQTSAIHLVVSDITMPRMGGIELKRKATALRPDVKFLFMSGDSEEVIEQVQTVAQTCAFLEKPFLPQDLVSKVQGLLRRETEVRTVLAVTKTA